MWVVLLPYLMRIAMIVVMLLVVILVMVSGALCGAIAEWLFPVAFKNSLIAMSLDLTGSQIGAVLGFMSLSIKSMHHHERST